MNKFVSAIAAILCGIMLGSCASNQPSSTTTTTTTATTSHQQGTGLPSQTMQPHGM